MKDDAPVTNEDKAVKRVASVEYIKAEIDERIAYLKKYKIGSDYKNGWMGLESGPCCKKCTLKKNGKYGNMALLSGCLDPFQINCSCHIAYRKVAADSELHLLQQIRATITCPRGFCIQDCDCIEKGFSFRTRSTTSTPNIKGDQSLPDTIKG